MADTRRVQFPFAVCDECGVIQMIRHEDIPEQDADYDDPDHDNRTALGVCGIMREDHTGDEVTCAGLVWYRGGLSFWKLERPDAPMVNAVAASGGTTGAAK